MKIEKTCHGCHVLVVKGGNSHFWEFIAAMASHTPKLAKMVTGKMTFFLHHMINYFEYNHTHLLDSRPPTTSFLSNTSR
jgi:hypothetical protein